MSLSIGRIWDVEIVLFENSKYREFSLQGFPGADSMSLIYKSRWLAREKAAPKVADGKVSEG